jgi:nitrate/nitrite-specific signal transduction histidine kinase
MIDKTKQVLMGLATISLLSTTVSAIEINSATQAVDIAGKQRMFTQRMLKDYAMVGMNNTFGKPDVDLKKTVDAFEDHLESLLKYTKDDVTKQSLGEVKTLWSPIKKILLEVPSKEKVGKLQESLEVLLKAADDTTKLFTKESGKESGKIVNTSGKQRMLSQRMASLYMLKVWGIDDPQFKAKLDEAMKLFKDSLVELEKSSLNTKEISTLLTKVKRSFMFFEMMSKSNSKFVPTLIYKKSNDMLKNMNSATEKYVALESK